MSPVRPTGLVLLLAALQLLQPTAGAPPKEIPSYIHICKRSDPHLEQCVISSVEKLRPKLMTGIPEMDVPPIDPLIIPEMVIKPSPNFQAVGKDVQVFGPSAFKITRLRIELNDTHLGFIAGVALPKLSFISDYEVSGRILLLPIKGKGMLSANVTDLEGEMYLLGSINKRKGVEYLRFYEGELKTKHISPVQIHLDNLFNGDKALGDATNEALNRNSEEMREVVQPVAEKIIVRFALDTANKIASTFPFNQLLPRE